jgi:hypothetical protein
MNTFATSRALITGSFLLILTAPASAQFVASPRSGDYVRVETTKAGKLQGRLIRLDSDSVVIGLGENTHQTVAVPRDAVTNVWVSIGQKRQTWRGLGIGFGAGAVVGGLISALTYTPCEPSGGLGSMSCFMAPESAGQAALLGGAVGGFFGLVIGGIAGFSVKAHTWEVAGVPTSIGLAPARHGATAVSLRIAL